MCFKIIWMKVYYLPIVCDNLPLPPLRTSQFNSLLHNICHLAQFPRERTVGSALAGWFWIRVTHRLH